MLGGQRVASHCHGRTEEHLADVEVPEALKEPVDTAELEHRQFKGGEFWRHVPAFANVDAATFLDPAFQLRQSVVGPRDLRERLGGNYIASMLCSGDRIYCFSITGKATVIRAGRTFEKLAESELDSGFMASPAVVGNALILRTKTHLYRIEEK